MTTRWRPRPSEREGVVHKSHQDGRNAAVSTTAASRAPLPGELLVGRLHVDLLRVSTAACRGC
ncbi:putative leader peptide [Modestobacter sp. I12A-02662]|uniref:putative leader peptide n=1 Tax=Modestobacter sp. I12A-02662 TaxID=1730496 RepID=UPI0034DE94A1